MARLLALALTGEPFVAALRRAWDAGDAVLPLDPRLPPAARDDLLDRLAPTHLVAGGGEVVERPGGRPAADGDALVLATSGTTSAPKGVVLTFAAVAAAAALTNGRLGVDPTTDRWLCCLPVSHAGGLGVVTRAVLSGTSLVAHEAFDAAAVDAAAADGATLTSLVPTTLARVDPARWRAIVLGGSSPPADRPSNVLATYGLTETFGGVVYERRALLGVELRIGADDVVEVRSPTLLRCYRNGDDDVIATDADGWFRTGDLGALADDGELRIWGRSDDVVVTGGEKVWPDALEAALRAVEGVAEVAIVGEPDPEWGERVVAVIVPSGTAPSLDALKEAARAAGPPWWAPKRLVVVEALPKTPIGKVRRAAVRQALTPEAAR